MKQYVKELSGKGRVIYNAYTSALRSRASDNLEINGESYYNFRAIEYSRINGFCSGVSYAFDTFEEYKLLEDALFEEFERIVRNYKRREEKLTEELAQETA